MAEAAVEQHPNRFFCHQCSVEISPTLPDFTCPQCQSGFIEEIDEAVAVQDSNDPDPAAQFAELWGRTLLESFRMHAGDNTVMSSDEDDDQNDDGGPASRTRSHNPHNFHHNPFLPRTGARILLQRGPTLGQNDAQRVRPIDSIVHQLLSGLTGGGMFGRAGGIPIALNLGGMYGNPGDYAWGAGGLDAIITQLLNQLDGTGPPPAPKEKIDLLPTVNITPEQVEKNVQCSVCMEDFKEEESVRRLPCNHHFHNDCIVPWLELHGTCPVCRKTLEGKDTSTDENNLPPPTDDSTQQGPSTNNNQSSSSNQNSSSYSFLEEYD